MRSQVPAETYNDAHDLAPAYLSSLLHPFSAECFLSHCSPWRSQNTPSMFLHQSVCRCYSPCRRYYSLSCWFLTFSRYLLNYQLIKEPFPQHSFYNTTSSITLLLLYFIHSTYHCLTLFSLLSHVIFPIWINSLRAVTSRSYLHPLVEYLAQSRLSINSGYSMNEQSWNLYILEPM